MSVKSTYVKYPKTFHLPWSPGRTNDDRVMTRVPFEGRRVIVTEKMDGENTTMYTNHIHARSLDSAHHVSRDWVKQFWSTIRHDIPENMRICGENMYAHHSIFYEGLPSFFLGFSIWEGDVCLSWEDTVEWFHMLGITSVPVLYEGTFDREMLDEIWSRMDPQNNEGYVVRVTDSFTLTQFGESVGKFVRAGHVQTDDFWRLKPVVPNKLEGK